MSRQPLVSVIIIFLNAELFLQEAIESVFAQTYLNWELLLVDDGSTDRSTKIARQHASQNPDQVYYLEHPGHQNRGMSASRNLGIQQAKGDFIAFLDADDIWLPAKIEQQVSILQAWPEMGMLYGNTLYWYSWAGASDALKQDYIPSLGLSPNTIIDPPRLLPLFLSGKAAVPCTCSILVRRQVLEHVGGFEESFRDLYEDQVFYAKICLNAPVFVSGRCWDKYRQYIDSDRSATGNNYQYYPGRLSFLNWLEKYMEEQNINDPEVWQALRKEQWRIRHPFWARIERSVHRLEKRLELILTIALVLLLAGCVWATSSTPLAADLPIPALSDWTDYGTIFDSGALGEWDYLLWGGFGGTAVKKNGTYYLYYQGASGYRSSFDETVTGRAIGVASSTDGVNFTKYTNNPVITWFPNNNNGEEGAASAGATLDDNGEIVLYYGANTEANATLVTADGRLATSGDGFNFIDKGLFLDHANGSIWGSGDELYPIIALRNAGQWFVYYIPNGSFQSHRLGVAWGKNQDNLANSSGALSGVSTIQVWGMGGSARVGPDTFALFLNDVTQSRMEVRTVLLSSPNQLNAPVETYQFEDVWQATVLLDEETDTWFMYYRNAEQNKYGVKLAPAGAPDTTPPTAPGFVTPKPISDQQIDLSWDPATDGETGIVQYKVFRNGLFLATVKGWGFSDTGLDEITQYRYEVSAVNYHGVEGPRSSPITGITLEEVKPPRIASVNANSTADLDLHASDYKVRLATQE